MKRVSTIVAVALVLFCFPLAAAAAEIPFKYSVIDSEVVALRAVADVNGDGKNDIIVASGSQAGGRKFTGAIGWYEYPTFAKHVVGDASACGYVPDMDIGDIDGDGDVDLIVPDNGIEGKPVDRQVFWFENPRPKGDPAGKWEKHLIKNIGKTHDIKDVEVEHMDDDKRLDVVIRTEDKVYIWFQEKPQSWEEKIVEIHRREGMDVGDPDVVLTGYWLENPSDPRRGAWKERNIDEKWWKQETGDWTDNSCRVLCADVNGDGFPEVVLSQSEKKGYPVSWYEAANPEKGPWTEHVIGRINYCHSLQGGDMDGDGDMDIVAAEMPRYNPGDSPVVVFINEADPSTGKGTGRKWTRQELARTGNYIAVVGDVGSDGDLDIVGCRSFHVPPLEVWENRTSEDKWKAVAGAWVRDCAPPPIDETGSVGWKVLVRVFFHGKLVSREETMYGDKTDHFKTASCSLDKGDGNTCNKTRHVFFPEDGGSVILPVVRADDLQPPPIDETGSVGYMVVVAIFSEGQLVSHKSTMYGDNTSNFRVTSCSLDEGDGNTCNKTRYVFFPENGAP